MAKPDITHPAPRTPPGAPAIHTVKEMSVALGRSQDYVSDMKRGGFKLPATLAEAIRWIRQKGPPTRYRLYGHRPSCRK